MCRGGTNLSEKSSWERCCLRLSVHKETKGRAKIRAGFKGSGHQVPVEPQNSARALQSCMEKERDKDRNVAEVEGRGSGLFYFH